jgi:hypothetical protein
MSLLLQKINFCDNILLEENSFHTQNVDFIPFLIHKMREVSINSLGPLLGINSSSQRWQSKINQNKAYS